MEWLSALHRTQCGETACFEALYAAKAPYVYLRALDQTGSRTLAADVTKDVFRQLKSLLPRLHNRLLPEERFHGLLRDLTDFSCATRLDLKQVAAALKTAEAVAPVSIPAIETELQKKAVFPAPPKARWVHPDVPARSRKFWIRLAAGILPELLLLLIL